MSAIIPQPAPTTARQDKAAQPILIVPGLHGSGPDHWQTHWEQEIDGALRVEQNNWLRPELADWIATLAAAVRRHPGAVLVAHSLGCALVSHLARTDSAGNVGAALLVAPADVNRDGPEAERLRGFAPQPLDRLPFPSTTVISRNDPYVTYDQAKLFAQAWGSNLVDLGLVGHINTQAGFGPWPEGRTHLRALIDQLDPMDEGGTLGRGRSCN